MVLHDLNLAARFSDWMIAMRSGRMLYEGTPKEIMTKETLADVFSLDACISRDPWTGKPICLSYKMMKKIGMRCSRYVVYGIKNLHFF